MLKNFLHKRILEHFIYTPTADQSNLLHLLDDFFEEKDEKSIMLIKGYAGTGKTSIISAVVKTLKSFNSQFVLLAPTGRAAKVLTHYSGFPAYTIHKQIYRQNMKSSDVNKFDVGFNKYKDTLFIVDEASMISNNYTSGSIFGTGRLLDDLLQYVYNQKSCRLIMIGDTAQLPPVNTLQSPALDANELSSYGFKLFEIELKEVIRQAETSGILSNATTLRKNLITDPDSLPRFSTLEFEDVERISGTEVVELIESEYDQYGMDEVKIICRSNKNANIYNNGIRNQILWREEELSVGDILMVVKNNYFWLPKEAPIDFIANGDIVEVVRLKGMHEIYGHRFQDVLIRFVDYPDLEIDVKFMLDTLQFNSPSLPAEESKQFYEAVKEDYSHLTSRKKQFDAMRQDPFLNAIQVKFAYALTCHKAQGGQWKRIFIDQGYISKEMMGPSYYRWMYTAITRATEKVYLVNFPDDYFTD